MKKYILPLVILFFLSYSFSSFGAETCCDNLPPISAPSSANANATTSSANITDNAIVRGDGGAKGVQESVITIADTTGDVANTAGNFILNDYLDFSSTKLRIYENGTIWMHNFVDPTGGGAVPDGYNIFLGEGAGNFTVGSTATQVYHGSYNIGIGKDALDTTTTGYYNIGIGSNALTAITTGEKNIGIGENAVDAMNTGNDNIGIGYNALTTVNSNTNFNVAIGSLALEDAGSGSDNNVAVGGGAGYNITLAQDNNTFIGHLAGSSASGPVGLTGVSNSVFLGYNSQALNATGDTNEVVIGFEAVGHGSDTSTIGGANMASHYLFSDLDLATGNEQSLTIYGEVDKATSGDVRGIYGSWKDTASPDNFYLMDLGTNSATDGAIGTHTSEFRVDNSGNIIFPQSNSQIRFQDLDTIRIRQDSSSGIIIDNNLQMNMNISADNATGDSFIMQANSGAEIRDSDGRQAFLELQPNVNQSATGAYDGIRLSVYEAALGDGSTGDGNNLLNLGTNSATSGSGTHTSKFKVDNSGNVWASGNSTEFGDMFINGTDALTINQTSQLHAMDGFSTGEVYGVTFDAGGVGTGSITTSGGGAAININDVGHGLVAGDYVTVTSANHEGVSAVTYVDADNFTLAIAYVGDEACQWQQGSSLKVSDAGKYMVNFSLSGNGAAASKDFYWGVYKDATLLNNLQVIRSTSTSYGSMSISGIVDLAADDVIYITMENRTDANNWSTEYADLSLSKL